VVRNLRGRSERHIIRQREIIKLLERTGGSADRAALLARDILVTMQERLELCCGRLS